MREHLHLTDVAAKLRTAAAEEPLGELPKEICLLLEMLGERERARERRDEAGSSSPS